jgi:hypothetical protein
MTTDQAPNKRVKLDSQSALPKVTFGEADAGILAFVNQSNPGFSAVFKTM